MLSNMIWVYLPSKPSMRICLVPVTASVKLASTAALVSKASLRLQQAARHNSSRPSDWTTNGSRRLTDVVGPLATTCASLSWNPSPNGIST